MDLTAVHVLLLVRVFTLTTQELVGLSVSPRITAECDEQVTLQCRVSPSPAGLSIKHMEWSQSKTSLCSVNGGGNVSYTSSSSSGFRCEYGEGQLSLVFQRVQPENANSGLYMCKLQSNMGALHGYTPLELEECAGTVHGSFGAEGPACIFNKVHPDGDVHWFRGSRNLSDGPAKHHTAKSVGEGGWLTVHSNLEWRSADTPFNCSLKSSKSGRYIASTLIQKGSSSQEASRSLPNGVRSHGPFRILLCVSVLLSLSH